MRHSQKKGFGEALLLFRKKYNQSQSELAKLIGLPSSDLDSIEKGNHIPSLEFVRKLDEAHIFSSELEDLMGLLCEDHFSSLGIDCTTEIALPNRTVRTYSYIDNPQCIAVLDILGFTRLTLTEMDHAQNTYIKFINTVERYRYGPPMNHVRDVPCDPNAAGHRYGTWYRYMPPGSVNFILGSDSLILYSTSVRNLLAKVSHILGAALAWGVPLRGGICLGTLFHSEYRDRPATSIPLYGPGLINAMILEKANKGTAMRVYLSDELVKLMISLNLENLILESSLFAKSLLSRFKVAGRFPCTLSTATQLRWWRHAMDDEAPSMIRSELIRQRWDRWKTLEVWKWLDKRHKSDCRRVIHTATRDLASLETIGDTNS